MLIYKNILESNIFLWFEKNISMIDLAEFKNQYFFDKNKKKIFLRIR